MLSLCDIIFLGFLNAFIIEPACICNVQLSSLSWLHKELSFVRETLSIVGFYPSYHHAYQGLL